MTAALAQRRGAPLARITWMLARPGADSAATVVLPAVAFTVTTALLLTVAGGGAMFWSWPDDGYGYLYQTLSLLALALMVVPLASLSGAAARLSARRRDDRLATLRLLGATPSQVARITVLESTGVAVLGAVVGVVLYFALTPFVGLIPFLGEPIGAAALILPAWAIAAIVAGVILLAALSSVVGLRKVIISPLGVRMKQSAPKLSWLRGLVGFIVVVAATGALSSMGVLSSVVSTALVLGIVFAIGVAVLNLVGPWVIGLVARFQAKRASTAHGLIAARSILESPKAAWRQVSGLAMTSFVAVVGGTGIAFLGQFSPETRLEDIWLLEDVRTGILITLVGSFLMVACSVGVNQASAVLDRRDLYVGLDRVGMPREMMERARVRAIMVPLCWVSIGSGLIGGVLVLPLAGMTLITAPASLLVIAGSFALGMGLVWGATGVTRPVVAQVLARPERV